MYKNICSALIALGLCTCLAQSQVLPVDRHTQQALLKHTRDLSGRPGKAYWQNSGDYLINVYFNPLTREVKGTVLIDYSNNSPDTLKTLVFKLYPNLYKGNAMRNTSIAASDLGQGVRLTHIELSGKRVDSSQVFIRGTNMTWKGMRVLPHEKIAVSMDFEYTLNKGSFNRTGQIDEGTFFIAYFFPRLAVYDDVDGWNEYAYLGKEEFYNDYGDFKVSITVPGDYCVWATGDHTNKNEVYEPRIVDRINTAEQKGSITDVITGEDLAGRQITKKGDSHTWKFVATRVTDFAFALSRNYIWKSSSVLVDPVSKRRTRVDAVYNPGHVSYRPVIAYNRKTVEIISHSFPGIPFPYAHQTIIDGLDAMEYPMMINNLPFEDPKDVVEFTAHEVFHTIFPFFVGTNETKYSFMDEGWATLTEFMFHPQIAPDVPLQYDLSAVNDYAGLAEDVPLITPTAQLYGNARYEDKDLKPALALWYLRDLLGEKKFAEATRYYIRTWEGRHPTPYDFFNCMNEGAGMDLNWFWKKWYIDKAVPDLAISKVSLKKEYALVTLANIGGAPVPVHLTLFYANGKKQAISRPVTVWQKSGRLVIRVQTRAKISRIQLGDAYDADSNVRNNSWNPPGAIN